VNDPTCDTADLRECRNTGPAPPACTYCGDGLLNGPEDPNEPGTLLEKCDDGNSDNFDNCRNDCTPPLCGDGIVDPGETCDTNPVELSPGDIRPCRAPGDAGECTFCGDNAGKLDLCDVGTFGCGPNGVEVCDDGNSDPNDFCDNECMPTTCDVRIDKQVSCDGGLNYVDVAGTCVAGGNKCNNDGDCDPGDTCQGPTFNDIEGCTALDEQPIMVRYEYENIGQQQLFCEIDESNNLLGPDIGQFSIPIGATVLVDQPGANCSETLDGNEPNTATINCDCVEVNGPLGDVSDSDTADFDCIECNVSLDKSITVNGTPVGVGIKDGPPATTVDNQRVEYKIEVTTNSRDTLRNCIIEDQKLGINQDVDPLDDPVTIDIPEQCTDGPDGTEGTNTAKVTCTQCEGTKFGDVLDDLNEDEDEVTLICLTPDLSASKDCVAVSQGVFDFVINVNNNGETYFDCEVGDQVVPGECPTEPAGAPNPTLTGSTGIIAPGGDDSVVFEDQTVPETSCNNATVTCTITDAQGVPEMDDCIIPDGQMSGACAWSGEPCVTDLECGVKIVEVDVQDECPVTIEEGCRMTGGQNTMKVSWEEDDPGYEDILTGQKYTTGGQIGAPNESECYTGWPIHGQCVDNVCDGGRRYLEFCDLTNDITEDDCPPATGRNAGIPWGEWEHNHHSGTDDLRMLDDGTMAPRITDGSFAFHSGTASAPKGETRIQRIICRDPGWCVQARPAPNKQLFWNGVGVFHNLHEGKTTLELPDFTTCPDDEQPVPWSRKAEGYTLHYYRAHVLDAGESDGPGRHQIDLNDGTCLTHPDPVTGEDVPWETSGFVHMCNFVGDYTPIGGSVNPDKGSDSCVAYDCAECPDFYEIEIFCNDNVDAAGTPANPMAYKVSHHIRQGNFQIHPPVGDTCFPDEDITMEPLQY
jgi:hypothetical protein